MRFRLLTFIGSVIVVTMVVSAALILNDNEELSSPRSTNGKTQLEVRESRGEPQPTSHLLQGNSNGSLQSGETSLQDSGSSQNIQPNSGEDSF